MPVAQKWKPGRKFCGFDTGIVTIALFKIDVHNLEVHWVWFWVSGMEMDYEGWKWKGIQTIVPVDAWGFLSFKNLCKIQWLDLTKSIGSPRALQGMSHHLKASKLQVASLSWNIVLSSRVRKVWEWNEIGCTSHQELCLKGQCECIVRGNQSWL